MPQLIAMVIVVVGAMIYMFQTFGGTGDKIEGIAQKTSIITEINNIKNGLKLAAGAEHISVAGTGDAVKTLEGLAEMAYFAEQINNQLDADTTKLEDKVNVYNAISFGGSKTAAGGMQISLVADKAKMTPGIFVDLGFSGGSLTDNAAFLEAQIATDLEGVARIDRTAKTAASGALPTTGTDADKRIPIDVTGGTSSDGKFIVYFKDFGASEVVKP